MEMSRHRSSPRSPSSSSSSSMEIAAIPEFKQPHRMTQSQSSQQRRKNLALSCTVLCAVGAATALLPDGWGGPLTNLRGTGTGRSSSLKESKQRRLQLAAADYSALLAGSAAAPSMGASVMGAAPSMSAAGGGAAELSDADVAKFLAKYDLELQDLELLQKLREGYVRADGTTSAGASAASASAPDYSSMMAAGGAPPVPPPEPPAAPATDYAALLGAPAASSSSAPEVAAAAPPAAATSTTTSAATTPLAVPLGPIEDCSGEADNWLQNFCELGNYKNTYGDCNVS